LGFAQRVTDVMVKIARLSQQILGGRDITSRLVHAA
jgi:hypothetical protein